MSQVMTMLQELQQQMTSNPAPISEIRALYRFTLKDTAEVFDIHLADSVVQVGKPGDFSFEPVCVISLAEHDMVKLLNHSLNTTIAYMMGQIKVEGKLGSALKLLEALAEYK